MELNKKAKKSDVTKQKLLQAVEEILAEEGFTALKVENISRVSGVDKKLIYFHFGDLNGLLAQFLRSKDFWFTNVYNDMPIEFNKEMAKLLFVNQFTMISQSSLLNQLLIWELSDKNSVLRKMSQERDDLGKVMIDKLVEHEGFTEDVQPVLALLVAGIYYLSIHNTTNGSTFCGIDIKNKKDADRLVAAIVSIVDKMK